MVTMETIKLIHKAEDVGVHQVKRSNGELAGNNTDQSTFVLYEALAQLRIKDELLSNEHVGMNKKISAYISMKLKTMNSLEGEDLSRFLYRSTGGELYSLEKLQSDITSLDPKIKELLIEYFKNEETNYEVSRLNQAKID